MSKRVRAMMMDDKVFETAVKIGGGNFSAGVVLAITKFFELGGECSDAVAVNIDLEDELRRGVHPSDLKIDKRTKAGREMYARYSVMYEMRKKG